MTVDEMIAMLQRVKDAKGGDTLVQATSFCGTNQAHVLFDIQPPKRKKFNVSNHMNEYGFCIHVNISPLTRQQVAKGIEDMFRNGYRFYRSQFCKVGESPSMGLSPCEWHNPW